MLALRWRYGLHSARRLLLMPPAPMMLLYATMMALRERHAAPMLMPPALTMLYEVTPRYAMRAAYATISRYAIRAMIATLRHAEMPLDISRRQPRRYAAIEFILRHCRYDARHV